TWRLLPREPARELGRSGTPVYLPRGEDSSQGVPEPRDEVARGGATRPTRRPNRRNLSRVRPWCPRVGSRGAFAGLRFRPTTPKPVKGFRFGFQASASAAEEPLDVRRRGP